MQQPGRLEQVADVVRNNVDRLAWLIENVQRLARLDNPLEMPTLQRVEATTMATEVVRQLQDMAAGRAVEIMVQPAMPVVITDPARLELILLNLVSNGIKYSDPAKPLRSIEIGGEPAIAGDGTWSFYVRDNGLGIPESDQAAVFDRFFRAHGHLDQKLGISGSGLGLSIVADCLNAIDGTIRCESMFGQGATFVVTLHNVVPPPLSTGEPAAS